MPLVQILGPGCPKCQMLHDRVQKVAAKLGIDCTIEKITDMSTIVNFGVLSTPALVIDGEVKVSGRVPSDSQIEELLA